NFINKPYYCYSVAFCEKGRILTAIDARGIGNGIWSTIGRASGKKAGPGEWIQLGLDVNLTTGATLDRPKPTLPNGIHFGRTSLAVAPSDPKIVYAFAGTRRGGVLGLYRSNDGGHHWRDRADKHIRGEQQTSYTNCIAVHPEDPDFVVAGG